MVQDNAQIRRRGAHDFLAYYDFACARQESVPLPAVTMNLDRGMLDFNGDRIKLSDWPPILDSIAINKQLHHIAISSSCRSLGSVDAERRFYKSSIKRKIPAIRSKDLIFKLSKALRDCLTVSPNLKTLQLDGLPLRERDLIVLTKGLAKSVSLENLSLANCPISDEGLEIICQSVKYSTCIRTVDFSGCSLTWKGAEHMANIIKHQGMQRHGTAWAESLRYRLPHFEKMTGLRRVTLNCNTLIGDRGAAALANELAEDLWVKAVDLQKCGLSNEGARRLLETLKTNSTLSVLDVRCNPLVDKILIKTIIEKVLMNADGESPEYNWIKPAATEPQRAPGHKRQHLPASFRGKSLLRNAARRANSSAVGGSRATQPKPCSRSRYVPWRTAARAGRQRGLPPGATAVEQSFQGAATVKVTIETDSEEDDGEEDEVVVEVEEKPSSSSAAHGKITERQFARSQMELRECRLMLAEERRARLNAETRLKEFELENARLRTTNVSLSEALANSASAPAAFSALEDEAVLDSIESSFKKFHAFLDLLKDAGLGQLVSMAGLEKSDFQPIGKPQFSSTLGPLSQQVKQCSALPEMTDPTVKVLSPPLIAQAEVLLPKSSSSPVASLHGDRQLDMTFTHLARPTEEPGVSGEGTKDQYYKRIYKSSSDQSVSSQKSSEGVSLQKHYQTQPSLSAPCSESNSHRSKGSHRSSHSSHGRVSSRSSISEVISEKGGSARSRGSKRSDRVNLGFDDRLGSGGSVSSENDREDILKQVTTLSGMGPQSFGSLF